MSNPVLVTKAVPHLAPKDVPYLYCVAFMKSFTLNNHLGIQVRQYDVQKTEFDFLLCHVSFMI